jgi:hypothetical protein
MSEMKVHFQIVACSQFYKKKDGLILEKRKNTRI